MCLPVRPLPAPAPPRKLLIFAAALIAPPLKVIEQVGKSTLPFLLPSAQVSGLRLRVPIPERSLRSSRAIIADSPSGVRCLYSLVQQRDLPVFLETGGLQFCRPLKSWATDARLVCLALCRCAPPRPTFCGPNCITTPLPPARNVSQIAPVVPLDGGDAPLLDGRRQSKECPLV